MLKKKTNEKGEEIKPQDDTLEKLIQDVSEVQTEGVEKLIN